ncbi:MAG: tetratricopeptide repeat protein [Oligoflexales bacterium]|nr:tetratricopeptide repeat protein [Oligoflexales bacterium]
MQLFSILVVTLMLNSACSFSLWGESESEQLDDNKNNKNDQEEGLEEVKLDIENQVNIENIELKQARMWARIDELEGMLLKQREKVKMLEKGLLLGVTPKPVQEEQKISSHPNQKFLQAQSMKEPDLKTKKDFLTMSPDRKGVDLENVQKVYSSRLQSARVLFKEGRFGKAYLDFAKLDREFESSVTKGETKYWLGRCWYKLKELQQAKNYLNKFIRSFPTSPWVPSAKYYLAKVELDSGLRELAIKQLRNLIREHPYEGSSEAAKQMLKNLNQTL